MRVLISCVFILNLYAQAPSTNDYERLATRISQGDSQAILAAGASADVRFLPILRTTVSRYLKRDKAVADDARLALAKLGDQHEIEGVLCELHGDDPYVQTRALRDKLRYIGGWVAINALRDFLPDTPENQKGTGEGDVAFGSRTHVAISVLRDLLPAGPPPVRNQRPFAADDDRKQAQEWQRWIEEHKRELMELKPVGNYQPANCFQYSPVKALLRGMVIDPTGAVVRNYSSVEVRATASQSVPTATSTTAPLLAVQTDREGQFTLELPAGSYHVCVARFPKSCRMVVIEAGRKLAEHLVLKINPADDHASSELLDHRIRAIAGTGAEDCGHVWLKESPTRATACALRAAKRHQAFFVRYDQQGIDSEVAEAMAGDSSGKIYYVGFDSMGTDTSHLQPGETMPDGFHTVVVPCSVPVRLRRTQEGKLTCFSDGRWLRD